MTRVLLTGVDGFIGKKLFENLQLHNNNFQLYATSRNFKTSLEKNKKIHFIDLINFNDINNLVTNINPNIVIHLAYSKTRDKQDRIINDDYFLNLKMSFNIIESTRNLKSLKKFIFFGSCDEYGLQKKPYEENQKELPLNSYALSKLSITNFLKLLNCKEKYPSVIIRPSVVYGEGQNNNMFLPSLANSLIKKKYFNMTSGEQYRDYIYVDDLIEAIKILINNDDLGLGEIINISYGKSYKLKEIATILANLIKKDGETMLNFGAINYRKSEVMNYYASNKKALDLLGWYPKITMKSGLEKIASSYII